MDKMKHFQDIELTDQNFSPECQSLLEGLLKREVNQRIGCKGQGYILFFFNILIKN